MKEGRYEGDTRWQWSGGEDPAPATAAVTADRITIDASPGGWQYSVRLAPVSTAPGWWRGEWSCKSDGRKGAAKAKLSVSDEGDALTLEGIWVEDSELRWITELIACE
jgi:hypothetical protein